MRRALVTGGASPIGAAIVRRLAADGASAEAIAFDLTDTEATAQALAGPLGEAPIQILVHNAGAHDDAPLAGMTEAQWRHVIDVTLHGFYAVARPLLLPMIRTRWGRVVAVSSLSGVIGNRGQANYAAAKAGLIGAVKSLSLEYASRGVTANAVAPGIIESPATAGMFPPERIAGLVPMKRAGRPEEVADLVGFLASDRAAYITGQTISINGGIA